MKNITTKRSYALACQTIDDCKMSDGNSTYSLNKLMIGFLGQRKNREDASFILQKTTKGFDFEKAIEELEDSLLEGKINENTFQSSLEQIYARSGECVR